MTADGMAFQPPATAPAGLRGAAGSRADRARAGRFLRTVWRTHFYAALIATPVLLILTVTGLVILYAEPLQGALHHKLLRVPASASSVTLQVQRSAADAAVPSGMHLVLVTPSKASDRSSLFQYTADDTKYVDVFVNPHTGTVLGSMTDGDDLVGLANRLHSNLNNDAVTVPLPSLAHLMDSTKPGIVYVPVGDVIIETSAVWALVLALSGIYLWWPRSSQKGKRLLGVHWRRPGRLRWRDVHATSGILMCAVLLVFITTGLPWSSYWGDTWSTTTNALTPSHAADAPVSTPVKAGTLDRFGHRISWATREDTVPGSAQPDHQHQGGIHGRNGTAGTATTTAAGLPAALDLDSIAAAAKAEGMRPGWSVTMPVETPATSTSPASFGSYQLSNAWPQRLHDEQTVYLDQYTGATLSRSGPTASYGTLGAATEFGVLNHMGTEFGLVNRIVMTAGCVLLLVSIGTSLVMWWKRRPSGRAGLPRRPAAPRLPKALIGIAAAVAVVYPLWAVSLLLVLGLDRFVVQRVPRLRWAFGLQPVQP